MCIPYHSLSLPPLWRHWSGTWSEHGWNLIEQFVNTRHWLYIKFRHCINFSKVHTKMDHPFGFGHQNHQTTPVIVGVLDYSHAKHSLEFIPNHFFCVWADNRGGCIPPPLGLSLCDALWNYCDQEEARTNSVCNLASVILDGERWNP